MGCSWDPLTNHFSVLPWEKKNNIYIYIVIFPFLWIRELNQNYKGKGGTGGRGREGKRAGMNEGVIKDRFQKKNTEQVRLLPVKE